MSTLLWALKFVGHLYALEFIGGPLDGYKQVVTCPLEDVAQQIVVPINANVMRRLRGRPTGEAEGATSAAAYALSVRGTRCHYRYLGPLSAEEAELDGWAG